MPNFDIWRYRLNDPNAKVPHGTLNAVELARAKRFRRELDRRRYVRGREILRSILASYLDVEPASVPLTQTPAGKPVVEGIDFSVAHAADDFVCAVTFGRSIGIDFERDDALQNVDDVLYTCTPRERELIQKASEPARAKAFLRFWTRKEAALKAAGLGFGSAAPSDVEVADDRIHLAGKTLGLMDLRIDGGLCAIALEIGLKSPFQGGPISQQFTQSAMSRLDSGGNVSSTTSQQI